MLTMLLYTPPMGPVPKHSYIKSHGSVIYSGVGRPDHLRTLGCGTFTHTLFAVADVNLHVS